MQHEITHQILGEYSAGGTFTPWLSEGVAEVLEAGAEQSDGRLVLPHGYRHPDVAKASALMRQNALPSVPTLLSLNQETFHTEPNRHTNYVASGALCRFILEMKDGLYAADFLEYLFDAYRSRGSVKLSEYIGMDSETLDKQFKAYLTDYTASVNSVSNER